MHTPLYRPSYPVPRGEPRKTSDFSHTHTHTHTHTHIFNRAFTRTYSNKHRKYTETMIKREYEFEIPQTHVFSLLIEVFIVLCSLST